MPIRSYFICFLCFLLILRQLCVQVPLVLHFQFVCIFLRYRQQIAVIRKTLNSCIFPNREWPGFVWVHRSVCFCDGLQVRVRQGSSKIFFEPYHASHRQNSSFFPCILSEPLPGGLPNIHLAELEKEIFSSFHCIAALRTLDSL